VLGLVFHCFSQKVIQPNGGIQYARFYSVIELLGLRNTSTNWIRIIARLYAGPENLCEIATSKGLKPVTTRRIAPSGGHARVLFVFELIGS